MTPQVAILDYGCGNLRSVYNAVREIGGEPWIWGGNLHDFYDFGATHLILPGQGHYQAAATDALLSVKHVGRERLPILGICLGMQLMCEGSEEAPGVKGLGWLPYQVIKMPVARLPHVGWNTIHWWNGEAADYYFCHSYAAGGFVCDDHGLHPRDHEAYVMVEGKGFLAAAKHANLWAVQFHPEKSGKAGLAFLREFLAL